MKVLIVLATALLVPVMMKFQERTLLEKSNPKTALQIRKILAKAGVGNPEVTVRYLEATIGGKVESEQTAKALVREITDFPGVSEVRNELVVEGWFRFAKNEKGLIASGIVTPEWKREVLAEQPGTNDTALKTRPQLKLGGRGAVAWGLFVDQFFQLPGAKRMTFLGAQLTLEGEALPSEVASLWDASRSLGSDVYLDSRMKQRASIFHFAARSLESPIGGEPLRRLSPRLSDQKVTFEAGSATPDQAGWQTLEDLVVTLKDTPSDIAFIIGCYPDDDGPDLALKRSEEVENFLVEAGLSKSSLSVIPFEKVETENKFSGQVELLIR